MFHSHLLYTQKYKITIDFDSYPQDISWILYDVAGNVVESGGGYAQTLRCSKLYNRVYRSNKGPYRLVISDGFADGLGSVEVALPAEEVVQQIYKSGRIRC